MVTGLMVGRFEQLVNGATVKIKPMLKTVVATITGNTGRRVIVAAAKCNSCHEQLGTQPEFHNGERNDPTACAICHTPNEINDGNQTLNYGWAGASNTYIHGIHAATKRSVPFTWAAWDFTETDNVSMIEYPGVLKKCDQCHLPNTVNFGVTGTSVAPNMLYTTTSAGLTVAAGTFGLSPYVVASVDYGLPTAVSTTGVVTEAAATTLVNSPMASACFSCHDTSLAKAHIVANGGSIYEARSTALGKTELCLICHGAGRVADVSCSTHRT
jgi:OmcA/MtrC family decaheme c-type cytochrome